MAVHRSKSSQRISPESERLVADSISLAASGSQLEDRFWEERLRGRLQKLLKSHHQTIIDTALDQTFRINTVAFEVLADTRKYRRGSGSGHAKVYCGRGYTAGHYSLAL